MKTTTKEKTDFLYEIKLTGSGTIEEISTHLLQLSVSLFNHHVKWDNKITWEDPYIYAEINKV